MTALIDAQNKYDLLLAANAPDTKLIEVENLIAELQKQEDRDSKRKILLDAKAVADAKAEQLRLANEQVKLHDTLLKRLTKKLADAEPLLQQIVDAANAIDADAVQLREYALMAKHHGQSIQCRAIPAPDVGQAWNALKTLSASRHSGLM